MMDELLIDETNSASNKSNVKYSEKKTKQTFEQLLYVEEFVDN